MPRRIYKVPETRLPFINGEISQIEFQGKPHLVSGIWGGGHAGGRIYFWDPISGAHAMRMLPANSLGAYFIKTGPDGKLYIGDGRGDLHRYDPSSDKMETLVTGKIKGITWGGCVTDRLVVWTCDPGDAVVYDWREGKVLKVISPVDTSEPYAHYGHNILPTPDGKKILLMMDTPQARICELELSDLLVVSRTPAAIVGEGSILNAAFFDETTLFLLSSNRAQVVRYPDYSVIKDVGLPKDCTTTYSRGGKVGQHFYVLLHSPEKDRDLYRVGPPDWKWERLSGKWMGEDTGYLGAFQDKLVAGISVNGIAHTYDPATGKTTTMDVENAGVMEVHALGVGPENNVIVGAPFINGRFWTIDLKTGEGMDRGRGMPAGGQINQIMWDAGRHKALITSYTEAAVMEYDPTQEADWPRNPRVIASARSEGQMRPWSSEFDRRAVWMATSPAYGTLGGALSRVDPEANQIRVWRNIVPDQTINALALDLKRRRLFFSSQIYADSNSCPPTQTTAEIGVFDIDALKLIKKQKFRDGVPAIGVVCMLPDGKVLVREGPKFYSWDCDSGAITELGEKPGLRSVAVQDDGVIWIGFGETTGRLKVIDGKMQFTKVLDVGARQLQIADGILYGSVGVEVHAYPLAELA